MSTELLKLKVKECVTVRVFRLNTAHACQTTKYTLQKKKEISRLSNPTHHVFWYSAVAY